ncbi:MAG: acyl-CoA dehydrogenase family protein [Dehalococcoidia bacterium]
MDFTLTEEQLAWQEEVREFFRSTVSEELLDRVEEDGTEWDQELYQALADKKYTAIGIPEAYGGMGMGFTELAIFNEEGARASLPHGVSSIFGTTCQWVAVAVIRLGTEEQKRHYLPRLISGEYRVALGLTEPGCGSDLAAVDLRAVQDGDDFILNGQKIFNSGHLATHLITVSRTDPSAPKHKGISLLLADLRAEGVEIYPVITIRGWKRTTVVFEDVRVPKTALLGQLNRGWYDLMSVMDMERSGMSSVAEREVSFDKILQYVKEAKRDGKPLVEYPAVRSALADMYREIVVGRLLSQRVIWLQATGQDATSLASFQKLFNSEAAERLTLAAMDIIGPLTLLEWRNAGETNKRWAPLKGLLNTMYKDLRIGQIYGGTSEIQRNIIATRELRLPRG